MICELTCATRSPLISERDSVKNDERLPNKRLKLPGGDRFKGSGVLCAGALELSFNYTAPGRRVARSLSAIR